MLRTFAGFVLLLALLALMIPTAGAGPPEGVSGKMVFDEVWNGLRQYRREKDSEKRIRWLERLAPTRDPRVAVLLGGEMSVDAVVVGGVIDLPAEAWASCRLLGRYFLPPQSDEHPGPEVQAWWEKNEADLRRRAKQLPQ
jgi:hypothetical protein